MPKVSFRMASASRESVFGVQTSTARKNNRSGHTEGWLTTSRSNPANSLTHDTRDLVLGAGESPLERHESSEGHSTLSSDHPTSLDPAALPQRKWARLRDRTVAEHLCTP